MRRPPARALLACAAALGAIAIAVTVALAGCGRDAATGIPAPVKGEGTALTPLRGAPELVGGAPGYRNPVAPGDFPDPTVVRVGGEYWATATNHGSQQPVFQLLRSRDLVNWQIAGAVFPRPPRWATDSWWAPSLVSRRDGLVLYYSAKRRGREGRCIGVAATRRPQGPWRDRGPVLCRPGDPIDPATVEDRRGRLFLVYKSQGAIRAVALSRGGDSVRGRSRVLLTATQAWEQGLVEAPVILRRGGSYFLLYSGAACCGRPCNYGLGVARARSPLGPYRKPRINPILGSSRAWRCPGHAGAVQDARGRTWLLYHAYPRRGLGYVGRELLLDRLRWRAGWPVLGEDRDPSVSARAPAAAQRPQLGLRDDFTGRTLSAVWQWGERRRPPYRVRRGSLELGPARNGETGELYFASVPSPSYRAAAAARGDGGGLGAFWGSANGVWVQRSGPLITAWTDADGPPRLLAMKVLTSPRVLLRISARFNRFRFAASADGRTWVQVGRYYDAPIRQSWAFGTTITLRADRQVRFDWIRLLAQPVMPAPRVR